MHIVSAFALYSKKTTKLLTWELLLAPNEQILYFYFWIQTYSE